MIVLVRLSLLWSPPWPKVTWKERVSFAHILPPQSIAEGRQSRNPRQEPGGRTEAEPQNAAYCLRKPRTISSWGWGGEGWRQGLGGWAWGGIPPMESWAFPDQSSIKKAHHRLAHRSVSVGAFSLWTFPLPKRLQHVSSWLKANKLRDGNYTILIGNKNNLKPKLSSV